MRTAQSSHIMAHEYDEANQHLMIQFTNGAVYQYHGINPNTYYAFAQSSSKGEYFHSKIKPNFKSSLMAAGPTQKRSR